MFSVNTSFPKRANGKHEKGNSSLYGRGGSLRFRRRPVCVRIRAGGAGAAFAGREPVEAVLGRGRRRVQRRCRVFPVQVRAALRARRRVALLLLRRQGNGLSERTPAPASGLLCLPVSRRGHQHDRHRDDQYGLQHRGALHAQVLRFEGREHPAGDRVRPQRRIRQRNGRHSGERMGAAGLRRFGLAGRQDPGRCLHGSLVRTFRHQLPHDPGGAGTLRGRRLRRPLAAARARAGARSRRPHRVSRAQPVRRDQRPAPRARFQYLPGRRLLQRKRDRPAGAGGVRHRPAQLPCRIILQKRRVLRLLENRRHGAAGP